MSLAVEVEKRIDRLVGVPLVVGWGLLRRRRRVAPARGPVRSLLLVKLWGLGNLAMLVPVVRAARRAHPKARIVFLTLEENVPFLSGLPELDRILGIPRAPAGRATSALLATARRLRRRVDLAVDFEPFLRATALFVRALQPGRCLGFSTPRQARAALYDETVAYDPDRHVSVSVARLARRAGFPVSGGDGAPLPPAAPRFPHAAARAEAWIERHRPNVSSSPLVLLHPGSSDHVLGRRWPPARFASVGRHLARGLGARLFVTGSSGERALTARICAALGRDALDLGGRLDVATFVELLARMDYVVTNDTAPAHLAAALGVPQAVLFGPNHPRLYGPISPLADSFHAGLPCSPCITNQNAKTTWCRRAVCLELLEPEFVAARALARIAARRRSRSGVSDAVSLYAARSAT